MDKITLCKTDEKLFKELFPDNKLTHYFKTKDNVLRIAFFDNNQFIAIETPKGNNTFKTTVLDNDENKMYYLTNTKQINDKKGNPKYTIYTGNIIK